VDARTAARVGATLELAVDPRAPFHYYDPASGDRLSATGAPALAGRLVTKQRETRDRVLELIEPLSVGDAIPAERQLGIDLGVSRLTVRAALDELVREGYLVRRRGAGTFVAEPKVAKGIDNHLVQRRHARPAGSRRAARTLDLHVEMAGRAPSAASCMSPPRRQVLSAEAPPASRTARRWRSSCCTRERRSSRA